MPITSFGIYFRTVHVAPNGQSNDSLYALSGSPTRVILSCVGQELKWIDQPRPPTAADVNDAGTLSTANFYQDLSSEGPIVEVPFFSISQSSNFECLVTLSCSFLTNSANTCYMSFDVRGATRIDANDAISVSGFSHQAMGGYTSISRTFRLVGLNGGLNAFRARYKMVGNDIPVVFERRSIVVQPLPVLN